jgi:diguanylate cyclase (GGDEF)-like protein/PAS domain S-box-containing protein
MLPTNQSDWNVPAEARIDAELLKALLDYVEDGVCLLDRTNHVLYWNYGAEQITGHLAQEVTGRHCRDGLELCYDCEGAALIDGECPLSKVKHDGRPRESLIYMRHKQGHRLPVRMRAHAILDSNGTVTAVAEIFTRASAQGRTELAEAARHLGHDALTGAQNRAYGEMRLRHELEAKKLFGLELAWMRVDIDGIEGMRYNYGPALIDATMRLMAHTIDANLRSFDGLMRWDETSFRVMVRHAVDQRVRELARRLEMMAESSEIQWWGDGRKVKVSIGSVMAVEDDTVESLEERVERALEASRALKILQG